jgi:3-phenylpropionate/trans-cinnamate dioxygenase ferredoxin subunit
VGSARSVVIQGEPVCLVRLDDTTVRAVHNTCSHAQFDLDEGWVEGNTIECSLHGSSFDLDTGQPDSLPAVKPIPTYAVKVEGGDVMVDASVPTNGAPLPRH